MTRVWVVRSRYGRYTDDFVRGGYVAAGWLPRHDLTECDSKEAIVLLYRRANPHQTPRQVGAHAGQIAAFALGIGTGDYVITPRSDTEWLAHGRVRGGSMYYAPRADDGCPFPHRWRVEWAADPLRRWDLSIPFQNTLKAHMSVFRVSHAEEFLLSIAANPPEPRPPDFYRPVLGRILELDTGELQDLVGALLEVLGFEETGEDPSACGGGAGVACVIGELGVANLASVRLLVQIRRDGDGGEVEESVTGTFAEPSPPAARVR